MNRQIHTLCSKKTDVIVNEFPLSNTLLGSLAGYRATFPVSILFVLHDGEMFQLKKLNMGLEAYGKESEGLVYQIGVPINLGLSLCIN